MSMAERLLQGEGKLCIIGLGYVGIPLAVAFAEKGIPVIGYDVNEAKIQAYRRGMDVTREVGDQRLAGAGITFTSDPAKLREGLFHIIAVPTPVYADCTPDLAPVLNASRAVGKNLQRGAYVVYESTVYPGLTEERCIPLLEETSTLRCGVDFKVGYSPERINPGDQVHRLETIVKIVAGIDAQATREIDQVYRLVIKAGTCVVSSIRTAEMVKVAENTQRDCNIAFVNEMAMMAHCMGVDMGEVIEAMNTKWNALRFNPGLVGGHCIGVDPYYLIQQAEKRGFHSRLLSECRRVNEYMSTYIAEETIRQLLAMDLLPRKARVGVLGVTFKENCADLRNTKVLDIVRRLQTYGMTPLLTDPMANEQEVQQIFGLPLTPMEKLNDLDCIFAAVAHREFRQLTALQLKTMCGHRSPGQMLLIDVKSIYTRTEMEEQGFRVWRL